MVTSPEYRHVPTGTLAILAQRLGRVSASPSTGYRLVRKYGWRRPQVRVHPAKPKVGVRTTGPDELWHIDTTVIRLLVLRHRGCGAGRPQITRGRRPRSTRCGEPVGGLRDVSVAQRRLIAGC
jgi:hypothetical protein